MTTRRWSVDMGELPSKKRYPDVLTQCVILVKVLTRSSALASAALPVVPAMTRTSSALAFAALLVLPVVFAGCRALPVGLDLVRLPVIGGIIWEVLATGFFALFVPLFFAFLLPT